uniref:Uncharacterized protein n=1 Tax=Corethron hystrix TaxID=216773 RepID=A0A7S1FUK8_9STRA|mmetsp:Transcript_30557/g.69923  ORF Transcript_30557/g.69923 Transcript_30557/m.69923 type:complete len:135 (+) Transcript_30557:116-520(+)
MKITKREGMNLSLSSLNYHKKRKESIVKGKELLLVFRLLLFFSTFLIEEEICVICLARKISKDFFSPSSHDSKCPLSKVSFEVLNKPEKLANEGTMQNFSACSDYDGTSLYTDGIFKTQDHEHQYSLKTKSYAL